MNAGAADGTSVTNQTTVDFTGATTGFDLTSSSNPVTVIVSNRADLAVTKSTNNPNPNVGDTITFTLMLTNNGPQDATGVQVTDLLPPNLTFVGATPSQGTYTPGNGLWDVGSVANGGTATLQIEATVTTADPFVNRAQITAADQFDPNPNNNFDAVTTPPQTADLVVDKDVDNPTPHVGETVTFTLTLTNNGPNDATTVSLTDLLPSGLQFVTATPSPGSYDAATGVWTVGTVANGTSATLQIQAVVVSPNLQTNTATVRTADQFDPNLANNSDGADVTPQQADLALAKTVNNPTPNVGDQITYTINLTNNGLIAATNVTVLDILPSGVIFVSSTLSQGTFDSTTATWTVGTVTPGTTPTLQLTVVVNAAGSLANNAQITGSDQFDPNPGNNTANTTITVPPQPAELSLAKSVSNPTPNLGELVFYTVTLTNNGPGIATSVLVLDILPPGLTFVSASPSQGDFDPTTNVWQAGTVAVGGRLTLQLAVIVNGIGSLTNTAEITGGDSPDPILLNNVAQATIQPLPNQADVSVVKVANRRRVRRGMNVIFTFVVGNRGPNTAHGVVMRDVLPRGLRFVRAAPGQGTFDPASGTWTVGTLPVGGAAVLRIVARVQGSGVLINSAQVAALEADPNLSNNAAVERLIVMRTAVSISKWFFLASLGTRGR